MLRWIPTAPDAPGASKRRSKHATGMFCIVIGAFAYDIQALSVMTEVWRVVSNASRGTGTTVS